MIENLPRMRMYIDLGDRYVKRGRSEIRKVGGRDAHVIVPDYSTSIEKGEDE